MQTRSWSGRFLDPEKGATYYATVKLLALVHFVYFSVKAGAAQRYSELMQGNDQVELAGFARDMARWTFWPSFAIAILVLVAGKPLLYLFGAQFTEVYPLLFIMVIGVVARASVGPARKPSQNGRQAENLRHGLWRDAGAEHLPQHHPHSAIRSCRCRMRLGILDGVRGRNAGPHRL